MGLDMYLEGDKFFESWGEHKKREGKRGEVKSERVDLGYWRKHFDLHGFIVKTFNGGEDDCRPIELDVDDLRQTLKAVEDDALPHTEDFFFGQSEYKNKKEETIQILNETIAWLSENVPGEWRSVEYCASW